MMYLAELHILLYRADYNPDQYLWEKDFTLAGRAYKRQVWASLVHSNFLLPFLTLCL
jgi:hypothetical protein